jgi:hypothetical protein
MLNLADYFSTCGGEGLRLFITECKNANVLAFTSEEYARILTDFQIQGTHAHKFLFFPRNQFVCNCTRNYRLLVLVHVFMGV